MARRWIPLLIVVFQLLFMAGCASHPFEGWTRADTYRQAAYTAVHCADWMQTHEIASNDDFLERNGVLGSHPSHQAVDIYMGSTLAASWLIAGMLDPEWREVFQVTAIVFEAGVVARNYSIGIRW
ncbi:hypothetical protein DSCW_18420 [Desulfosarcina widdelii]|uniref:Lipoprotein n=1 Tax=Desulfosarcina widdelii TaxID=947919 RepID=A0A5K7Z149_9BACT|nr:hypothetical protein [Desulfosarcina widdelii]BBO74425.1 hypothetical protein DSCW_18420 [Desulfosarcina widdelii]